MTPVKIVSKSLTLEKLREAAIRARYSAAADRTRAGVGWGSSEDDDSAVNAPVFGRLTVGQPRLVAGDGDVPSSLRLRFYWEQLDRRLLRMLGDSAPWDRVHIRRAVDVVIYDDVNDEDERTTLISMRDLDRINADVMPHLEALVEDADAKATLRRDAIAESLSTDFFAWLLYALQREPATVGNGVELKGISEVWSKDLHLRGARFTESANVERIEVAALIVMGKARFGPAKISLRVDDLDFSVEAELYHDGGFTVLRQSSYGDRDISAPEFGHTLVDDMWSTVLPRMRVHFSTDATWSSKGRGDLHKLAVEAIERILPKK